MIQAKQLRLLLFSFILLLAISSSFSSGVYDQLMNDELPTKDFQDIDDFIANQSSDNAILTDKISTLSIWDENYGYPEDIFVFEGLSKTIAYIVCGREGLVLFDVTNPSEPKFMTQYQGDFYMHQIVVIGIHAIIATTDEIIVLNVRFINNIKLVYSASNWFCSEILIYNDYIILNDYMLGILIYTIDNDGYMTKVGTYEFFDEIDIIDLEIYDHYLLALISGGTIIIDISEIYEPNLVNQIITFSGQADRIKVINDLALITCFGYTYIYNLSFIDMPLLQHRYIDFSYAISFIEEYNGLLYAFTDDSIIKIYQLGTYGELNLINSYIDYGYFNDGFRVKDFIFVIRHYGLNIYYCGDQENHIIRTCSKTISGESFDVVIKDDYAFIADGPTGMVVLDVSNPLKPKEVNRFIYRDQLYYRNDKVTLFGDYVFIHSIFAPNILVLNISDPLNIERIEFNISVPIDFLYAGDILISDNICYIVDSYYDGSFIMACDISDITNPIFLSQVILDEVIIYDVVAQNSTLYLATGDSLLIYDFNSENNFTLLNEVDDSFYSLYIYDNLLYSTNLDIGLRIFNILNPSQLVQIGQYNSALFRAEIGGIDVSVENGFAYMIDYDDGLLVFDVSDPSNPRLIGSYYNIPQYYLDDFSNYYGLNMEQVEVVNNIAYICAGTGGVFIVHLNQLPKSWINPARRWSLSTLVPLSVIGISIGIIYLYLKRKGIVNK
ncbi:MAG: hypothetical protein FK734_04330 [Asgard group archaeon]|nr:hypothetical protein [Asgard group archaeon]